MSKYPPEVVKVFDAVHRAHWLSQVMDEVVEDIDDLPRLELWHAISRLIDEALRAVIDAEDPLTEGASA